MTALEAHRCNTGDDDASLSKWRQADLVEMTPSDMTMRLAPALISSSPLSF